MKLKITEKDETSRTIYYTVTAETKKGDEVRGTLIATWDDDNSISSYEFVFVEDDSDIKLTKKEIDEFEELAVNY